MKRIFADEHDYRSSSKVDRDRFVESGLCEKLAVFNLRENPSRREYFTISHDIYCKQPEFKKLEILLDSYQDLKRKMQLATAAFGRVWNLCS